MAETSTCTARHCKTVTPGLVERCPACGNRVVTSRRIRILGWVAIGCGVVLIGLMGAITLAMYPTLANPGVETAGGGRWAGTAEQARMVLNLFYLVIGFGVLALAAGAWMVATGRRQILITIATLLAAAVLLFETWETIRALKRGQEAEEARRFAAPPSMTPLNSAAPDKPQ